MGLVLKELTDNERCIIFALRDIAETGKDVELRNKNDGTFKIFEVDKKKIAG
ncbi:MAG: hypothetical protein J6N21_19335 [Butyrivibrio sp.]|nr:hypothetical protein [Butyrivibrio sp.]